MRRTETLAAGATTQIGGRGWLLPILPLLVLAEIGYRLAPASLLLPIAESPLAEIPLGLYVARVRRRLSRALVQWQRRLWGFRYGTRELELSTLVVGAVGLGFVVAGIWGLLEVF
jgi:hypothetical protein